LVRLWSIYFEHIMVFGPFDAATINGLESSDIRVHTCIEDQGWVTPIDAMTTAMAEVIEKPELYRNIRGVIMMHDDTMPNITNLALDIDLSDTIIHGDEYCFRSPSTPVYTAENIVQSDPKWVWWDFTHWENLRSTNLPSEPKMRERIKTISATFPRSDMPEIKALMRWYPHCQSDFVYITMKYADPAIKLGKLFSEYGLMLEMSFPTMVGTLVDVYGAQIKTPKLCTCWDQGIRNGGLDVMYNWCLKQEEPLDLIHPLKGGDVVFDVEFERIFEHLNFGQA